MQSTTDFRDHIAGTIFKQADGVLDDPTAFHTTIHMLNPHPSPCEALIKGFLFVRQRPTARFLERRNTFNPVEHKGQKAKILQEDASCWQGIGCSIGNALVMHASCIGVAQKQNRDQGVDQQHVFHAMAFFLAAIAAFLFIRVLGARDASLGSIMAKRGAVASATAATGTASR